MAQSTQALLVLFSVVFCSAANTVIDIPRPANCSGSVALFGSGDFVCVLGLPDRQPYAAGFSYTVSSGELKALPSPSEEHWGCACVSVNKAGVFAGNCMGTGPQPRFGSQGVLWKNGVAMLVHNTQWYSSQITALSENGYATGWFRKAHTSTPLPFLLYPNYTMVELPLPTAVNVTAIFPQALSANNDVAGYLNVFDGTRAHNRGFVYLHDQRMYVITAAESAIFAISADGHFVAGHLGNRATYWQYITAAPHYIPISFECPVPDRGCHFTGLNNLGDYVGVQDGFQPTLGFAGIIYDRTQRKLVTVDRLFPTPSLVVAPEACNAADDYGRVFGQGHSPNDSGRVHGFILVRG